MRKIWQRFRLLGSLMGLLTSETSGLSLTARPAGAPYGKSSGGLRPQEWACAPQGAGTPQVGKFSYFHLSWWLYFKNFHLSVGVACFPFSTFPVGGVAYFLFFSGKIANSHLSLGQLPISTCHMGGVASFHLWLAPQGWTMTNWLIGKWMLWK